MRKSAHPHPPPRTPPPIKRVFILGHSGFVGSRLVEWLQQYAPHVAADGRSFPPTDITRLEVFESFQDAFDLDTALVMLAGVKRQLGDNLDTFTQNLQMVVNLCQVLQARPVRRLIYFSSAAVYGEDTHNTRITEETPARPVSFYGIAKFAAECLLRKTFASLPDSTLVILRPPLIFGPGDQALYGPSGFVKAAARQEPITLWGEGRELREFLFVDDIVSIVHRLIFHSFSGVLNPVSGMSFSFAEVVAMVQHDLPYRLQVKSRPRSKPPVDNAFDNQRLKEVLPDISFTPLAYATAKTLAVERASLGGAT